MLCFLNSVVILSYNEICVRNKKQSPELFFFLFFATKQIEAYV